MLISLIALSFVDRLREPSTEFQLAAYREPIEAPRRRGFVVTDTTIFRIAQYPVCVLVRDSHPAPFITTSGSPGTGTIGSGQPEIRGGFLVGSGGSAPARSPSNRRVHWRFVVLGPQRNRPDRPHSARRALAGSDPSPAQKGRAGESLHREPRECVTAQRLNDATMRTSAADGETIRRNETVGNSDRKLLG